MKKGLLAVGMLFSMAHAQITVDSSDLASVGDVIVQVYDTMAVGSITPGSSTAQTWDYSNLNLHYVDSLSFIDPSGTPNGSSFPNSNLASEDFGSYSYFIKSATEFALDGIDGDLVGTGQNDIIDVNPNLVQMTFPSTLGTSFTSSASIDSTLEDTFTGIFDSLRIKVTFDVSSEIDAFGALTYPGGTEQVLRQEVAQTQTDSVWGLVPFIGWTLVSDEVETIYAYNFIANGKDYYVLSLEADAVEGNVTAASYQPGAGLIAGVEYSGPTLCYGENNGYAQLLAVGGQAPYTYSWSDGGTGDWRFDLAAGSYNVTVTEAGGSSDIVTVQIDDADSISIALDSLNNEQAGNDGAIYISPSGGTTFGGSYNYNWSNGENTRNITGLTTGSYSVTVTDVNGCTQTATYDIVVSNVGELAAAKLLQVFPNPTTGLVQVVSGNAGELTVMNMAGRVLKTERLTENGNTVDLSELAKGIYLFRVETGQGQEVKRVILK